jgi:hypothetical protein
MGKASKRHTSRTARTSVGGDSGGARMPPAAPFVRRPFEGLAGETEWVALREILPAATGQVSLRSDAAVDLPADAPRDAMIATVLPMAWPALHRQGGSVMVATQTGPASGDASRDLAAAWLLAAAADEAQPITQVPTPTLASPRLHDLIDPAAPFSATLYDGFEFWVGDAELDDNGRSSLEAANASIVPTARIDGAPSVYWVRFGERTYIRWVMPQDEDAATDGLARLAARGQHLLAPDTRLLGAFRACGLLVPVWEVDQSLEAESFADAVAAMAPRLDEAATVTGALSADERRARNGLLSRQVTLR